MATNDTQNRMLEDAICKQELSKLQNQNTHNPKAALQADALTDALSQINPAIAEDFQKRLVRAVDNVKLITAYLHKADSDLAELEQVELDLLMLIKKRLEKV